MKKISVNKINNHIQLNKIRRDWERIYQADSKSQIYCSWSWFNGWARRAGSKWIVVTVKDLVSDTYVAFFPLCIENKKLFNISLIKRMYNTGIPFSYYTGFLCLPKHENRAIEAIADFIMHNINWDTFEMKFIRDPRIESFVKYFPKTKYRTNLNNSLTSLLIKLPDSYNLFLSRNMGKSSRKRIKEKINHIQKNDCYHITVSTYESIGKDIDIQCRMWNNRWNKEYEIEWHRYFMKYFFKIGLLRLTILWTEKKPIATLSCFSDPLKKTYNAYLTSYDPEYSKLSPGIVLFADSIKYAIENEFNFYDLGTGVYQYKLSFGPQQIKTKYLHIIRKGIRYMFLSKINKQIKLVKSKNHTKIF